jgi:hypothetical protein
MHEAKCISLKVWCDVRRMLRLARQSAGSQDDPGSRSIKPSVIREHCREAARGIPRPAGENAGLRDDQGGDGVDQAKAVRAGSLAPLVKTRGLRDDAVRGKFYDSINAANKAARRGSSEIRTDSVLACAPSPTPPSPSSVGMPRPAVKFPSEPPPTATS